MELAEALGLAADDVVRDHGRHVVAEEEPVYGLEPLGDLAFAVVEACDGLNLAVEQPAADGLEPEAGSPSRCTGP